jgi:hypothetical protein
MKGFENGLACGLPRIIRGVCYRSVFWKIEFVIHRRIQQALEWTRDERAS